MSHNNAFHQHIGGNHAVNEMEQPEKNAIDYNYNTPSESSRNAKESSKSPSSTHSDRRCQIYNGAESAEDEEEAQDLSMPNSETTNHIT